MQVVAVFQTLLQIVEQELKQDQVVPAQEAVVVDKVFQLAEVVLVDLAL